MNAKSKAYHPAKRKNRSGTSYEDNAVKRCRLATINEDV
jgi:hypothetical protein